MSPGTLSLVLNLSYVVKPLAMTTEPENLVLDSLLSVVLQFFMTKQNPGTSFESASSAPYCDFRCWTGGRQPLTLNLLPKVGPSLGRFIQQTEVLLQRGFGAIRVTEGRRQANGSALSASYISSLHLVTERPYGRDVPDDRSENVLMEEPRDVLHTRRNQSSRDLSIRRKAEKDEGKANAPRSDDPSRSWESCRG
jgi:hypothetical protein